MTNVLISIGSNRNDPEIQIRSVYSELVMHFSNVQMSNMYLTEPVGSVSQDSFVNAAIHFETTLSAPELLQFLLKMELKAGRNRELEIPKGPRNLDLDIILFGNEIRIDEELSLPHPRFRERRFVLEPAAEIVPDMQDPVSKKSIGRLLKECNDPNWVSLLKSEIPAI